MCSVYTANKQIKNYWPFNCVISTNIPHHCHSVPVNVQQLKSTHYINFSSLLPSEHFTNTCTRIARLLLSWIVQVVVERCRWWKNLVDTDLAMLKNFIKMKSDVNQAPRSVRGRICGETVKNSKGVVFCWFVLWWILSLDVGLCWCTFLMRNTDGGEV